MTQKAIFIDRDDTLIDDPGVITTPAQLRLLPGAAQALAQLKKLGYLIFIVTNQPCIAYGELTEIQLEEIHRRLKKMLSQEGATVDGVYYCPYDPNGTVKEYAIESDLCKPQPGMLLKAAKEHDVDLSGSWLIGDRFGDIRAGHAAGCRTILVDVPGKTRQQKQDDPDPDRKAVNLREAANIIRMFDFHQKARSVKEAAKSAETPEKEITPPVQPPEPVFEKKTSVAEPAAAPPEPIVTDPVEPDIQASPTPPKNEPVFAENHGKVYTAKKRPATETPAAKLDSDTVKTHQMLEETLRLLKKNEREGLYKGEFSIFKLLALMFQGIAALCVILSIWFWLSPERDADSVLIMIGYAAVLQLAVIAMMMYSSE